MKRIGKGGLSMRKIYLWATIGICFMMLSFIPQVSAKGWYTDENQNTYYYDESNQLVTGKQTIDGYEYYFHDNGVMQKGFIWLDGKLYLYGRSSGQLQKRGFYTIDNSTYYTDYTTGEVAIGKKTINGYDYYFHEDGVMQKGFIWLDGKLYLYGRSSGQLQKRGFYTIDNSTYYTDYTTGEVAIGKKTINGYEYYFHEDGVMQKGFLELDGKLYLYGRSSGQLQKRGFYTIDNHTYYTDYTTGEVYRGIQTIGSKTYGFDEITGSVFDGFGTIDGNTYYFDFEKGIYYTGKHKINGYDYYFHENGVMQKGFITLNGKLYLYGRSSGQLQKRGFYTIDDSTYYTDYSTGEVAVGKKRINGYDYYFHEDGAMQKGFIWLNGKLYLYGRSSGQLQKRGFYTIDDSTYYTDYTTGEVAVGKKRINGYDYYFLKDGAMQKGFIWLDGKLYLYGRSSGQLQKRGFYTIDDSTYYTDYTTGEVAVGKKRINGYDYYFLEEGAMQKGFIELDGKLYLYGRSSGQLQKRGFYTIDDSTYYTDYKTGEVYRGWFELNGNTYYGDLVTGAIKTGKQTIDGYDYYFYEDGIMHRGFIELDGKLYLYGRTSGQLQKRGFYTIDNNTYYTDYVTGEVYRGLHVIDGKTYGFDEVTGAVYDGFGTIAGNTYYFVLESGSYFVGKHEIDGYEYYFHENGVMQKGFIWLDGKLYLYGRSSGQLQKRGFYTIEDNSYYTDYTTGEVYIGKHEIDGYHYYFHEDGVMQKGFITLDGNTYLYGRSTGQLQYGWHDVDGYMYYFDLETAVMYTGTHTIDGIEYVFYENGHMKNNFVTIDGNTYYYFEDGTRANDWATIAGTKYFFNSLGVMIGKNVKKVIDVSSWQEDIDWERVINEGGVDGVILRVAMDAEREDPYLAQNIRELQRLGIPYGIYIYSYAENYNEGVIYAQFTLELMKKYNMNPTMGIFFDLESNEITSYMGTAQYEQTVRGFMDTMASAGYGDLARIYTYKNYAEEVLNSDYLKGLITWIAQYYHYCTYDGNYIGWQYSSTERVPGIEGDVDMSVWFS